MRKNLVLLLATLFALANIGLTSAHAVENIIDYSKPGRYGFGICQTESQLDCLEPIITVSHKDGTTSKAEFLFSESNDPIVSLPETGGALQHFFQVRGGTSTGNYKYISVRTEITNPPNVPFGHVWLSVQGSRKNKSDECDEPLKKLCTRYTLDPEDEFMFVIRSQQIPEQNLRATAVNGEIQRDDYLTGERWVLKGSQTLPGWSAGMSWFIGWTFPDATNPGKAIRCAGNGVLFTASNALTAREPSWDRRKNSLNFGIQGPHFDANGDLFKGFFNARIPKKWLDCNYPENSLSTASEVVVSITYDDGTSQIATSSTRVTSETIYVNVPLLHFSSPTIRITNAVFAKSAAPSKTLRCVKGKVTKKVTANKCPPGWK